MKRTRREFMKDSGAALLGASALGGMNTRYLFAKEGVEVPDSPQRPTLVIVYLRGGSDPLHVVVPHGEPLYYQYRPDISIAPPGQGPEDETAIPYNRYFGFNPGLGPFCKLMKEQKAAAIMNVGSPHPTRSHFAAQDFMERAAPGVPSVTEGWLNRYLQLSGSPADSSLRAFSPQPLLPLSLRGSYPVLAAPDQSPDTAMYAFQKMYGCPGCQEDQAMMASEARELARVQAQGSPRMYRHSRRARKDRGNSAVEQRKDISQAGVATIRQLRELNSITQVYDPNERLYPDTQLGDRFQDVAQVIKANRGLEVAAMDYYGWDFHDSQGDGDGKDSKKLNELSSAMSAFSQDLGERMSKVLVLTMTEFGRTAKENGSDGTDHGHGGFMLAVGGMVNGGKIYGRWTGLDKASLYAGRDMPVHTDFRIVFAEVLDRMFGFPFAKHNFFPGWRPRSRPLGFLRRVKA